MVEYGADDSGSAVQHLDEPEIVEYELCPWEGSCGEQIRV